MSYFDKPAFSPDHLEPLSRDRIVSFMDRSSYNYGIDDDGDVGGNWDGNPFFFLVRGDESQILSVTGRWNATLPDDGLPEILRNINDWNREHIWPKVCYRRNDDATIAIFVETTTELKHGATEAQLDQFITCGLQTGVQAFSHFDSLYPDAFRPDSDD